MYPLATQLDHTELKYSLRSLEKFLKPPLGQSPFEVVIVGDHLPDWINNITHIELPDIQGQTQYSVRRKVIAALHYADEFLFMNDDIYLLTPTDYNFPYYSSGTLEGKGESGAAPLLKQLRALNKPVKYYGHYPSFYRKDFIDVINNFTNECVTKSAYCNFIGVDSIEIQDCKILTARKPAVIKEIIKDKPCFSTGITSLQSCLPVLEELFPEPSKFEI